MAVSGGWGSEVDVAICLAAGWGTEIVFVDSTVEIACFGTAGSLRDSLRSQAIRPQAERPRVARRNKDRRERPGFVTKGYENE